MKTKKKLRLNIITSLLVQVLNIVVAFILPRIILSYFGSEVNGLVNSITQFLSIIAFLEMGMGAVVQSAFYKPIVDGDSHLLSAIYHESNVFFKRIAYVLLVYMFVLGLIFPLIINKSFTVGFTDSLILAIGIGSFAQYYFGITNSLLLNADQKLYICNLVQILTIVLNMVASILLIINGFSIQIVKMVSACFYLLRPMYLYLYVKRKYSIHKSFISHSSIPQKWNGICQHVANVVLESTDTVLLTMFSTLSDVSIYSIYYLVVNGIKTIFISFTSGIQSYWGNIYAKEEYDVLNREFCYIEWMIHSMVVIVLGTTAVLITPFVNLYTMNIKDADYNQPLFGYIITIAYACYCLRLPYHILVKAAGNYKQTQMNYIVSAVLNCFISIILVKRLSFVGVAIGTYIAMLFQTVWLAQYCYKNILRKRLRTFFKINVYDITICLISFVVIRLIKIQPNNYIEWIIDATVVACIYFIVAIILGLLLYKHFIVRLALRKGD